MISLLLFYKIFQLFIFMLLGFVLVKSGLVKSDDSKVLSRLSLYLMMPSVIVNSFDITLTKEVAGGLLLSFGAAVIIHIILLGLDSSLKGVLKGTNVERASVIYSNAGNLIIPIVAFLLGDKWLVYTCPFISVQILFLWTHGISLFGGRERLRPKNILCNVNIIAIGLGLVMMLCGLRLPPLVKDVVSPLGDMLGTTGMIIAGMVAAGIDFRELLGNRRMYGVVFLRLVVCPAVMLCLMLLLKRIDVPNAENIMLITFLASITPTAATVMQFAQITGGGERYATGINIISTLMCIVTMPVFVALYSIV